MNWLRISGLCVAFAVLTAVPVRAEPQTAVPLSDIMRQAHMAEAGGRANDALELYRQAAETFPFDSAPLTAWGLLAVRYGAPDQAIELLTAALAVDAGDDAARSGLAEALVEVDRAQEALALYDSLLSRDPLNARTLAARSQAAAQVDALVAEAHTPEVVTLAVSETPRP